MPSPSTALPELPAQSAPLTPPGDADILESVQDKAARSRVLAKLVMAQHRERVKVLQELGHIRGFMPLLMKRRNGQAWTASERAALLRQFRAAAHVSPYLIVLLLPGSFVIVPILAWWLDRRRQERDKDQDL